MDFSLTEERRMLADSLRGTLKRGADWAQLSDLGVQGALFTEAEGGFGGSGFDIAVVFEELGRAGSTEPVLEAGLAGGLLADCGEAALVEAVIDGSLRPVFAHDEPGNRYDTDLRCTATDGRLSGAKTVVIGAEGAGLLVVSARSSGGLSLFAVDPGAEGVSLRSVPSLSGGYASEITFDKAPARLIGPEGGAQPLIDQRIAAATLALCADALGAMETVREMTLDYLRTRKQFGRPIGSFQALQHRMADVVIEIEQARSAVINLAGHLHAAPAVRDRHVSATKNVVGRTASLVAEESIQLHGGIAMTEDYALAPFARRLIAVDHRFGDEDWHMERFIALGASA
ncbi:MAG: pimeloyl-CoA dehydrogenase small subunit [Pararhodobacter sp.]|nr:pimeloyl-CoA dehydrogenase small subunit [Pararhodobacter sp.]